MGKTPRKTPRRIKTQARSSVTSRVASPESPAWVSGADVVFKTPQTVSPVRRLTRRSSIFKAQTRTEVNQFKVPAFVISPPGVKTRARRSSMYVAGGAQSKGLSLLADLERKSTNRRTTNVATDSSVYVFTAKPETKSSTSNVSGKLPPSRGRKSLSKPALPRAGTRGRTRVTIQADTQFSKVYNTPKMSPPKISISPEKMASPTKKTAVKSTPAKSSSKPKSGSVKVTPKTQQDSITPTVTNRTPAVNTSLEKKKDVKSTKSTKLESKRTPIQKTQAPSMKEKKKTPATPSFKEEKKTPATPAQKQKKNVESPKVLIGLKSGSTPTEKDSKTPGNIKKQKTSATPSSVGQKKVGTPRMPSKPKSGSTPANNMQKHGAIKTQKTPATPAQDKDVKVESSQKSLKSMPRTTPTEQRIEQLVGKKQKTPATHVAIQRLISDSPRKSVVSPKTRTPKVVSEKLNKSVYSTPSADEPEQKPANKIRKKSTFSTPQSSPMKKASLKQPKVYRKTPALKRRRSASQESSPKSKRSRSEVSPARSPARRMAKAVRTKPVKSSPGTSAPFERLSPVEMSSVLKYVTAVEKRKGDDSLSERPTKMARLASHQVQLESTPRVVKAVRRPTPSRNILELAENDNANACSDNESLSEENESSFWNMTINSESRSSRCIIL